MSNKYNDLCDPPVKKIHDPIHGYIHLSKFAIRIIDSKPFQRLRDLAQLGTCKFVYPSANHSRFEHSIGTAHLAKKLLDRLPQQWNLIIDEYMASIPELRRYYTEVYDDQVHPLDLYICMLIVIAALCHDLGHGPFSHVFDDIFIPTVGKENLPCSTHEERSGVILRMIIKNDPILSEIVHDEEIKFMINLINPKKEHTGFIYQIVSNSLTGLDVDKFDYLQRDIYMLGFTGKIDVSTMIEDVLIDSETLNLKYPDQSDADIINLFDTRYRLHLKVYSHKAVISAQFMIVEVFVLLDGILGLSDSINDMNKFCNITEGYILNSVKFIELHQDILSEDNKIKFKKAREILDNLQLRKLYPMIYHSNSKDKINVSQYIENLEDKENILCYQNKIGFVSGDKPNPLDSVLFYKTKNVSTVYKKNKEDISLLLPQQYQEYIITFYYKDKNNKKRITELYEYFYDIFKKG